MNVSLIPLFLFALLLGVVTEASSLFFVGPFFAKIPREFWHPIPPRSFARKYGTRNAILLP